MAYRKRRRRFGHRRKKFKNKNKGFHVFARRAGIRM